MYWRPNLQWRPQWCCWWSHYCHHSWVDPWPSLTQESELDEKSSIFLLHYSLAWFKVARELGYAVSHELLFKCGCCMCHSRRDPRRIMRILSSRRLCSRMQSPFSISSREPVITDLVSVPKREGPKKIFRAGLGIPGIFLKRSRDHFVKQRLDHQVVAGKKEAWPILPKFKVFIRNWFVPPDAVACTMLWNLRDPCHFTNQKKITLNLP